MPTVATGRKCVSDLVKGYGKFQDDAATNFYFASVDVKGSGDVDGIGTVLKWNESASAFNVFAVNADWEASTTYALGDVVKPVTQNGLEYVCITAGDSDAAEPTWPTTIGATETETAGAVWLTRLAYTEMDVSSPLDNGSTICVTVGTAEGVGFNNADVTLSATAVKMTVLFRGDAALLEEGFEWGSIAAVDQAEFYTALKQLDITVDTAATAVVPNFVA